jgi:PAS domain S-box-containing protein
VLYLGDSKKTMTQTRDLKNRINRSQERLDLCLSSGNIAWWEMELPSGKVIFNENKVKMLGYTVEDFLDADYKSFMNLVHPDDYERVMQAMKDHLDGKKETYDVEYRIRAKNGTYKWYYDKGSVVERDQKNKPLVVKGIVIDISKLKQSETLEKLSSQILDRLNKSGKRINQIRDILFLIKQSNEYEAVGIRIKDGNHYPYYETNGFPANFIKKANHLCTNERNKKSKNQIYECMCGRVINLKTDSSLPFFSKNGSFWTNNLSKLLHKNPNNIKKTFTRKNCVNGGYQSIALIPIRTDNEIIGLIQINDKRKDMLSNAIIRTLEGIGSSIGIAFAKDQAIKELQINERRYRLAQRAANIGSWDWNINTGNLTWSEKIEPLFGFQRGEFKGTYKAFIQCVHPSDRNFVIKSVNDCLKHKKRYAIEHRIVWPNGTVRWVLERGDVIRDKNDKPIRMLGVVQDVTNKRKMEEELKQKKDHLEKLVEHRTAELVAANKKLKDEIIERKKAEIYIERAKENLRNVIDSASELIISFDMNNRISTWNKTAENITGYKIIEVINRSVGKLEVFENKQSILDLIKKICEKHRIGFENIILKTKDNNKKIIRVSGTPIRGGNKECIGSLFVGRDITQDMELHGKLLDGCSYLITDRNEKSSIDLFINLILSGHTGLFITRASPSIIESTLPKIENLKIILCSQEKLKEYPTISTLDSLKKEIEEFSKNNNSIILINGIHYLLTMFSFDSFILSLYQINDIIAKNKSMLFVRIDPSTIDSNQLAIFENELQVLPSQKIEGVVIEDETYNVLKYIYEQNQLNALVSFKKVMSQFKIAYVTAANKLGKLEENGLIITKKQGKLRTIYITEKGKSLLHKRQKA